MEDTPPCDFYDGEFCRNHNASFYPADPDSRSEDRWDDNLWGGHRVAVFVRPPHTGREDDEPFQVVVCGTKDDMLVKDVTSLDEARQVVLSFPAFLNRDWLRLRGFRRD